MTATMTERIEERKDDAERLRMFAKDPNLTHLDRCFMCNIVTRNKVLGHITQEQVDTMNVWDLADAIEMGVK